MLAFSGAAAIGQVANVFKYFDMAVPLRVVQILPMELTIRDSFISVPTMCVRGLGDWLVGGERCVDKSIWLGSSFGAFAASQTALLCETALAT